jgi:hypothetical protein
VKRILLLAACLLAAASALTPAVTPVVTPALAETQIFVVDNTDGYEIDRCLAAGEPCGALAAAAICRTRQYEKAIEYGNVRAEEITASVAQPAVKTAQVVAVTCSR